MSQPDPSVDKLVDILEAMIIQSQGNLLAFFRVLRKGLVEHVLEEGVELDVQHWYEQQLVDNDLVLGSNYSSGIIWGVGKYRGWKVIKQVLEHEGKPVREIPQSLVEQYYEFLAWNKETDNSWLNVFKNTVDEINDIYCKDVNSKGAFLNPATQQEMLLFALSLDVDLLNYKNTFGFFKPKNRISLQKYLHQKNNERRIKQRQLQRDQFIEQDFQDYNEVYKALS